MEKYLCEICGKTHVVYRVIECPRPDEIDEIPIDEKGDRLIEFDGNYLLDKKFIFIEGIVLIYKNNELEDTPFFEWYVWVKIELEEFRAKLVEMESNRAAYFEGELISQIPYYKTFKGLKCHIRYRNLDLKAIITVVEDSALREDQIEAILDERVIEIMQKMYHNSIGIVDFEETFEKRFNKAIDEVFQKYINLQKDFAIDIGTTNCLFQIISNTMLESNNSEEQGFGLHLSFDETDSTLMSKFEKSKSHKHFTYIFLDDIPTYQMNVERNRSLLLKLVLGLIVDVYEEDVELMDIDHFECG